MNISAFIHSRTQCSLLLMSSLIIIVTMVIMVIRVMMVIVVVALAMNSVMIVTVRIRRVSNLLKNFKSPSLEYVDIWL